MVRPRQVMSVRINKKSVDNSILKGINTYLVIYVFILLASGYKLSVCSEDNRFSETLEDVTDEIFKLEETK